MSTLCPQCKSLFAMSKTGQYCDNCYYGASKAQVISTQKIVAVDIHSPTYSISSAGFTPPTYKDYYEPSEDQKRIEELEKLLQEITKELLEFSSNGKIEDIRSRIREILGE